MAWLFDEKVWGRRVAVGTVRGHVAAVKVLLATAAEDGLIRHNPAAGVRIARPGGSDIEPDAAEQRRALDSDELERFLQACPPEWALLFRLFAMTGIRVGEAIELRWKDIDFDAQRLRVRRQFYKGVVGPPKSVNGKRDIPLSTKMTQDLWTRRGRPSDLVFTGPDGSRLGRQWCWKEVLKPTAKAAGVPWASTPSAIRAHPSCSPTARTPSRCRCGSGIPTRASRCEPTSI